LRRRVDLDVDPAIGLLGDDLGHLVGGLHVAGRRLFVTESLYSLFSACARPNPGTAIDAAPAAAVVRN
jgi:hypothetical protein